MPPPSNTPQKYKITPTIKTSNTNCKLKTLNTLYIAENTFMGVYEFKKEENKFCPVKMFLNS